MSEVNLPDKISTHGSAKEILTRNASSMYLNVRTPHKPDRPKIRLDMEDFDVSSKTCNDFYDPAKAVQDLLNNVNGRKHRARKLFCELDVLKKRGDNYEWREHGRWVKYEETVEEGGKRWSKPHVASLAMHYIMELRKHLLEGVFLKDIEVYSIAQIIDYFLDEWIRIGKLDSMLRPHIKAIAMKHHRHRHQRGRPEDKRKRQTNNSGVLSSNTSSASLGMDSLKNVQSTISLNSTLGSDVDLEKTEDSDTTLSKKYNARFMRKLTKGTETANIMVGEVEDLHATICGFMRLNDAQVIDDLSEVELPSRFIIYILGPQGSSVFLKEMGRCMATMMVDDIFREVAYKSRNVEDILAGVDEFLEQVTVLPPGEWDPKIRIEPPDNVPPQEIRKSTSTPILMEKMHGSDDIDEAEELDPDMIITFKPFSGLITDVKKKLPWYISDFKDAIHMQCLPAIIYIFLTTLTNDVTFGAMMGAGTGNNIGVMECIFAGGFSCVFFAFFGGQPLNIIASTGPLLVLEKIIYQLCIQNEWDFLSLRFWVGMWTAFFLLIIVIFNLSALVRYITRFTQEAFACLIAVIFIYDAFNMLSEITHHNPVRLRPESGKIYFPDCFCNVSSNGTSSVNTTANGTHPIDLVNYNMTTTVSTGFVGENLTEYECSTVGGKWICENHYVPDVFLMSVILFATTFFLAIFLVHFRTWPCFPTSIRVVIGEFALIIAILVTVGIDAAVGLPTPKLAVPNEFKPSIDRPWILNPITPNNPWWLYIAAGLPALLATILIFMDEQITCVIINRKENKMVKGKGYHLDLLNISIITAIHSLFGLPWYVAETVNTIAHVNALKKESECAAPGEKPTFLGVREQRVTLLIIGTLIFLSVLITPILNVIPLAVLYGVFLYMGYEILTEMEFVDRILLCLMPVKFQPDYPFLRHVPLWRVHVFTFIQFLCLVAMIVVKSISSISIIFPLIVLLTAVVRKVMEVNFTPHELKHLDSLLPHNPKKAKEEKEENEKTVEVVCDTDNHYNIVNDMKMENYTTFFLNNDQTPPPAYDNKGFNIKL